MSWWNNSNSGSNNNSGWGSTSTSNVWGSSTSNNNNSNTNSWGNNTNSGNSNSINPNNDVLVDNPPNDAISEIAFNPSYDLLAVSSWNNTISCYQYDTSSGVQTRNIGQQRHDKGVLCCCWDQTGDILFSGGCDNTVRVWKVKESNNNFVTLGQHNAPIKGVHFVAEINMVITASWDRSLMYWDIRNAQRQATVSLPGKVFCSAQKGNMLVVGLSNKLVATYDLRNYQKHQSLEKTVLKHQLRAIEVFPDQKGFVVASIEGRTAIKHFDKFNASKDFSFKCHRHQRGNDKNNQDVFAVNTLCFNQQFGTFASGGDDGQINVWDKENRSRLKHFEQIKCPNASSSSSTSSGGGGWGSFGSNSNEKKVNNDFMPIVSLDFCRNGRILGYATSYNWNKGMSYYDQKQQIPRIYLHNVQQKEVDAKCK